MIGDLIADQHEWVVDTVKAMNKSTVNNPKIIASNAGTPGYDTCTELRVLEERGLQIKPDMVLLQYCPNDRQSQPLSSQSRSILCAFMWAGSIPISQMDFAFSGINLLDAQKPSVSAFRE